MRHMMRHRPRLRGADQTMADSSVRRTPLSTSARQHVGIQHVSTQARPHLLSALEKRVTLPFRMLLHA